ncbi:MAG: epoxyqueuosine reductase, partial [bacterium]
FKPPPTKTLIGILTMTEEDFRQTYRHSPVKRAKYTGLLRNACIAAGNSSDKDLLPFLELLTTHENPIVSECAKWAIRTITG